MHISQAKKMAACQAGRIAASMAEESGITQNEVAIALGINQSQVSRIFGGHVKRRSNTLDRVCNYVKTKRMGITAGEVCQSKTLIEALVDVWDGTERDAQAIAGVIRSLKTLRHPAR